MLEFVNSGLYFFQDENNVINPLLQVGSGSGEKSTGSGEKSTGIFFTGSGLSPFNCFKHAERMRNICQSFL